MSKEFSPYHQRAFQQGLNWVRGDSRHNSVDDECCPDFSCCVPELFEKDRTVRLHEFRCWCRRRGYPAPGLDS